NTLGDLSRALVFCESRLVPQKSAGTVKPLVAQGSAIRSVLVKNADSLADAKLFPRERVDALHKGSGKRKIGRDCVALAALYREFAEAIKGKTPITGDQIDEAARVGDQIQEAVRP